jgi:hypothetical protein
MSGVTWSGLDEYEEFIAKEPDEVAQAADAIMGKAVNAAATEIRAAYPVRTGELRDGVKVLTRTAGLRVHHAVTNVAPYAHYFEYGTRFMAAGKVFIPVVLRRRRDAIRKIIAFLEARNLKVSGDVG